MNLLVQVIYSAIHPLVNWFTREAPARVELALKLEPLLAAKAKENLKTSTGGANPRPLQISAKAAVDTRKDLARIAGVSHGTLSAFRPQTPANQSTGTPP